MGCLTALPVAAGTIVDVSNRTTLRMNSGDTLYFLISNLSLRSNLSAVEFQLVSQSLPSGAWFAAELTSRDGTIALDFPSVQIGSSVFTGSGYQGAVSTIFGTVRLPAATSGEIFQSTRATLVLHNLGSSVTLDLPGYRLPQDVMVSLAAGPFSAGAVVNGARYEDPPPAGVPEGGTGLLMAGGGALLCVLGGTVKRISHLRIQ